MTTPRIERPVHYGNVGLAFNESKSPDDDYVFPPENTRDVWSHIREITDRYGYTYQSDESGNFFLTPRNNPHVIQDLAITDVGGSPTEEITPNAYTGTYLEWTGNVAQFDIVITAAARVDLVVPIGDGYGSWTVTVTRDAMTVAGPIIINPDTGAGTDDLFYYDFRTTTDGSNPTVATLFTGFYGNLTLEITSEGGDGSTVRRLDCLQLWHTDPDNPLYSTALATDENAVTVQAQSTMDDMRNYVIIVGRRRAIVTDSEKLETNPNNPSSEFIVRSAVDVRSIANPFESDDTTITPNYIGFTKESIIFDSGIADEDFATYLARTFIFRQRLPNPNAAIRHTLIPAMQLRDPVFAIEADFGTIDNQAVLYTVGFTHRYSATDGAFTQVVTSSFPEFPSYEVREDIDINANFNGKPVANVVISWTSLSGDAQSNLGTNLAKISQDSSDVSFVSGKSVTTSPDRFVMTGEDWPPLPGTIFLTPSGVGPASGVLTEVSVDDGPYGIKAAPGQLIVTLQLQGAVGQKQTILRVKVEERLNNATLRVIDAVPGDGSGGPDIFHWSLSRSHILTVYRNSNPNTIPPQDQFGVGNASGFRITVTYLRVAPGVGSVLQTNTPYHHLTRVDYSDSNRIINLPWEHGDIASEYDRQNPTFDIIYRRLGPVDGGGAFLDPYTSGNVPFYDPYSSELGKLVNLTFDALVSGVYRISIRSLYDDTVVAWLSDPTGDPDDEEAHWAYVTAGGGKTYAWDGIDQVGAWNFRQSADYAVAAFGSFEVNQRPSVQDGFYAWNREELVSQGRQQIALISGARDGAGRPIFGQGTYAEWYILIEADTDRFGRVSANTTLLNEVGDVDDLDLPANDYTALIYTHLPEPTKVSISISDWEDDDTGPDTNAYDPLDVDEINTTANWTTVDGDARINNQKPVRTRFTVANRPGPQWTGNADEASVRLFRNVHLRANIFDQFITWTGADFSAGAKERKVTSRKLTVDDHTIVFQDDNYRKAKSFKSADGGQGTEWIFVPSDFKLDFRGIGDEPIVFGDYLQLTEVPGWNSAQAVVGSRSRYSLGFMSYLFYLSVYTQDRSGRFTWCINTGFLDRSKILRNQAADWDDSSNPTEWPDDMTTQFKRTVTTRQWTDEGEAPSGNSWKAAEATSWGFDTTDVGYALLRHKWKEHDPGASTIAGLTWASLTGGTSGDGDALKLDRWSHWHATSATDQDGRLPANFGNMNRDLGNLTSSELGLWSWENQPTWVPCVTRDWHGYYFVPPMFDNRGVINVHVEYFYGFVDYRDYVTGGDHPNTGDDAASLSTWHSPIHDMNATGNLARFWVGRVTLFDHEPTKDELPINSRSLDYQRQDDMIHYEQLRGNFSRGPRPEEPVRYVVPGSPYYQNVYRGDTIEAATGRGSGAFQRAHNQDLSDPAVNFNVLFPHGLFKTHIENDGWFEMTFRHEYIWESARLFPVDISGVEFSAGMNDSLARIIHPVQLKNIRYDSGAWAGWKDDQPNTGLGDSAYKLYHLDFGNSIFDSQFMPIAIGPQLGETTDLIFHMILVDSRRQTPVL